MHCKIFSNLGQTSDIQSKNTVNESLTDIHCPRKLKVATNASICRSGELKTFFKGSSCFSYERNQILTDPRMAKQMSRRKNRRDEINNIYQHRGNEGKESNKNSLLSGNIY